MKRFLMAALAAWLVVPACAQPSANLLKNGSFEGGKRYWYETDDKMLVLSATHGAQALRIERGGIQSAAFELKPNVPVTLSFSAKADAPATMGWQITPCDREVGVRAGQTWSMRGAHPTPLSTEWKRYSVSFTPTLGQNGFWPRPTYMVQLGDCDQPFLLDAVTVAYGSGADGYVPRRSVEAVVDSPDLPGFKNRSGNTLPKGATIKLIGHLFNATARSRNLTLRWQLFDYEGTRAVSLKVERKVLLAPGQTQQQTVPMKLSATGLVLARFSVIAGGKVLDSSDLPVTTLPYPKPIEAKAD